MSEARRLAFSTEIKSGYHTVLHPTAPYNNRERKFFLNSDNSLMLRLWNIQDLICNGSKYQLLLLVTHICFNLYIYSLNKNQRKNQIWELKKNLLTNFIWTSTRITFYILDYIFFLSKSWSVLIHESNTPLDNCKFPTGGFLGVVWYEKY